MFQEIPVNDEHIIAFKATGKLTHDDYQQFLPQLEPKIEKAGCVSVLLELEDFHGWELAAAKDDYEFGKKHAQSFKRIAIVGDQRWGHLLAIFSRPFIDAEVRYFAHSDLHQAWDWLRESFVEKKPDAVPSLSVWRQILMPTDFSLHADHALRRAVDIARRYDARLTLLHAVEEYISYNEFYDPLMGGSGFPVADTETTQLQIDAVRKRLEKTAAGLDLPKVDIEVPAGSPKAAIHSYAEAQQVDVIVMGSHGRKGLARLLGSTTHAVLHGARCDVLSVPLSTTGNKPRD